MNEGSQMSGNAKKDGIIFLYVENQVGVLSKMNIQEPVFSPESPITWTVLLLEPRRIPQFPE